VNPELSFPVLLFTATERDALKMSNERFFKFRDCAEFASANRGALAARIGGTLIDNRGRTWAIRNVRCVGYRSPLWLRALAAMMRQDASIEHWVEHDIEEVARLPFTDVQTRVCESLDRNLSDWKDPEALGQQSQDWTSHVLENAKASVNRARNVEELFSGLDEAWAQTSAVAGAGRPIDPQPRRRGFLDRRGGRREFALIAAPTLALEAGYIWFLETAWPQGPGDSAWAVPAFLALFLPIVVIMPLIVRRLHDVGRSAIWIFVVGLGVRIMMTTVKGTGLGRFENEVGLSLLGAALFYLALLPGDKHENAYGAAAE
jgi:uncharacterized membrane protein YhaH (DUF805 family)